VLCWSTGGLIARLVSTDSWTTVFWRSVFCAAFLFSAVVIARRGRLAVVVREIGWPGVLMASCFATASQPGAFSLIGGAVILSALIAHTAADLVRPPQPPGVRNR
jgi:hypothetical protein